MSFQASIYRNNGFFEVMIESKRKRLSFFQVMTIPEAMKRLEEMFEDFSLDITYVSEDQIELSINELVAI